MENNLETLKHLQQVALFQKDYNRLNELNKQIFIINEAIRQEKAKQKALEQEERINNKIYNNLQRQKQEQEQTR